MSDISFASVFKIIGLILSGPHALCGFNFVSSFSMPTIDMSMSGMDGNLPALSPRPMSRSLIFQYDWTDGGGTLN